MTTPTYRCATVLLVIGFLACTTVMLACSCPVEPLDPSRVLQSARGSAAAIFCSRVVDIHQYPFQVSRFSSLRERTDDLSEETALTEFAEAG
jgi:hypothetical protein